MNVRNWFRAGCTSLQYLVYALMPFALGQMLSCAGQIPPAGGPPDTDPPMIIRTIPDSAAVRVQTDRILLEFDEYVDRRSVEESIFISPYVGQLEFDWSGREVEIRFSEPLRSDRTYVLNVGTDVVDVRARNRMGAAFTLAFSTGDAIDMGQIRGRVFDEKPEGVMVFAYALNGILPDTLDPAKSRPDYITQTGKEGIFSLSHIAWGNYRILAVRDEYRNLMYDRQIDQYGVAVRDIQLNENQPWAIDLGFRLTAEDTSKPFLSRAEAVNAREVHLRFSERIDTASFGSASFIVADTLLQQPLAISVVAPSRTDSTLVFMLLHNPLDSARGYRVSVRGLRDLANNVLDTNNASLPFSGVATPDTTRPVLSVAGIRDSVRDVPLEHMLELRFSEPVRQGAVAAALQFKDSSGNAVAFALRWLNSTGAVLVPSQGLRSASWYSIVIAGDSVMDYSGNRLADSTVAIRFRTFDLRLAGSIEGNVVDADTTGTGVVYLTAESVEGKPFGRTLKLAAPSAFNFQHLPEGRYVLRAFRDADSSGAFTYGLPFPFKSSERFTEYGDTLKVRARWSVDGVNVMFRK